MTWLTWQVGESDERKREVWTAHQRTGLDETLKALVETFGAPEAVAIRPKGEG